MGKALLVLVLSSGLILTKQLFSAAEHESETNADQADYQDQVVAREIAQSAFNVGMGVVRSHGEKLQQGVVELNGSGNTGRSGTHTEGRFAGGSYEVRANLTSGHSVRVTATGTYRDAEYVMHDEYRVPVLTARDDGILVVRFLESMAGYCSAVFYQAYTLDMPEGTVPEPVMLFAPDNRDRRTARPAQTIYVEAGTQMNFFIAVDENCSEQPPPSTPECEIREFAQNYEFDASNYNHVHYALDVEAGQLDQATESDWGLTEQHPNDRQRWRVSWEDIHDVSWINMESDDPTESLHALKMYGYDGYGWPDADAWQYRQLRDYGSRPDFSDQVIEIQIASTSDADYLAVQEAARTEQAVCDEPVDPPVVVDPVVVDTLVSAPPPVVPDDELTSFACTCTNNGTNNKQAVLHRPPGNESNEQLLCLPEPAVRTHDRQHNDAFPKCDVRRTIRGLNNRNR